MKQIDEIMGKIVSDEEYAAFVNNLVPASKLVEIEKGLIKGGEADSVVFAAIGNYKVNKKEADETWDLGKEYETGKNNPENFVGIHCSGTLIKRTVKNNKIMKLNITQEEVLKVQELSVNFFGNEDKSLSTEQNLVNFLLTRCPGTTLDEASLDVQGIIKGVDSFTHTLNEVVKNGSVDYKAKLQEVATQLSMNDQYTLYLNFLIALGNLDASTFSADKLIAADEFEQLKGQAYEIKGDVTQEQLDELIEQIDSALANNTFCLATSDTIHTLVEQLPSGTKAVTEFLNSNVDDIRNKQIMALCTYIAYLNGDLNSLPDGVTAGMIGIAAAAGIEQEKIMNDVRSGRTTFETAAHWIKVIGGVALWCGLAVIVSAAGAYLAVLGMAAICSLIGWSLFAMVIAATLSTLGALSLAGYAAEMVNEVTDFAGETYDRFIEYLRVTAYPWISAKIRSIVTFVKGLFLSHQIQVNGKANAAPQVVYMNS